MLSLKLTRRLLAFYRFDLSSPTLRSLRLHPPFGEADQKQMQQNPRLASRSRRMEASPEGPARIVEVTKRRWAEVRVAAKRKGKTSYCRNFRQELLLTRMRVRPILDAALRFRLYPSRVVLIIPR
jgi:hypothetical protein